MSITPSAPPPERSRRRRVLLAVQVALVRLRFLLVLATVVVVAGSWHVLRAYWDRFTHPAGPVDAAISSDTEYWCPMCPGVLSDWPGKCPVCNMALVRRKKGEAVPLPDGVLARMQFSPYRVQLAGVRTAAVEFQPLAREVVLAGFVQSPATAAAPRARVQATVYEKHLPFLSEGQSALAGCDLLPGHAPFMAHVRRLGAVAPDTRAVRVEVEIDDPGRELRPGMLVTVRARAPVAGLEWGRRALHDEWREHLAVDLTAHALFAPAGMTGGGAGTLARMAAPMALASSGLVLSVPEGAVVDHGTRKVVFVETGPGMFDGVEVVVGPRCGDSCPVLHGLAPGQRVVTAGAFLLDAETRLNPALAAAYFGAARGPSAPAAPPTTTPTTAPSAGGLSAADRALAARQKVCPVTGQPLDSMGGPVRVEVAERTVFICCKGCEAALRKDPAKYLSKLPPP